MVKFPTIMHQKDTLWQLLIVMINDRKSDSTANFPRVLEFMKHMLGSIEPNLNPEHNWIDTRSTRSKLSILITQGYSRWNTQCLTRNKSWFFKNNLISACIHARITTVCTKHWQVTRKHVYPCSVSYLQSPCNSFWRSCRYPWPLSEGTDKLGKAREKKQFLVAHFFSSY